LAPKTVIVRHAEKLTDPMNPDLSDAGLRRASLLTTWLPHRFGQLHFLFASSISKHSARPFETIKPLAKQLGLPIGITVRWLTNF
jgi:broad specificity phosphatase PhoE